jgi:hypothetical protein
MNAFEETLARLDPSLFGHIESQSTRLDQRSLLALHQVYHARGQAFVYLEIGSHLGGSLQALVRDPLCRQIISIDSRPKSQPDERGMDYDYPENSTARMLQLLGGIPGADLGKIHPLDASTENLKPNDISPTPEFCFIDGEHTDQAVLRDARFCLSVVKENGCIVFHDAGIIYRGLFNFVNELKAAKRSFRAYNLPDSIFVVELGPNGLAESEPVHSLLLNNHEGYLWSLMANDGYRTTLNRPFFRFLRRLKWIDQPVK